MNVIFPVSGSSESRRRRFAFVGTGGRVKMFLDPIAQTYARESEIVGLCDLSLVRARYHQSRLREKFGYREVPVFGAPDFGRMLAETKPDEVVVCTIDRDHDRYIVPALEAGCDVITEKPLTIDATRCARIFAAVARTGRQVRVAFNYRWAPGASLVKQVLSAGTIGTVRHVTMEYLLNTSHGADYFRRWHANKADSGGLLVHKSTHHFDLINWWIDAIPQRVFATGGLFFYGKANALRRGDDKFTTYARYRGQETGNDPFAYRYENPMMQDQRYEEALYLEAEQESGYVRDRNVFREGIDIEDVMNVQVRYRTGQLLSYSLNAFSPYEGYRVSFTGDRGRVEYAEDHGAHWLESKDVGAVHAHAGGQRLWVYPHFKAGYEVPVPQASGGHGGGDALLQEQLFAHAAPADGLGRTALHEQGAASILTGIAANVSLAEKRLVEVESLMEFCPQAQHLSQLR